LRETVNRMRARIAAIRSAAEILTAFSDVPAERRARFHTIIHEESRALSDVGEALAAYLDKVEESNRALTPLDEVEAMFAAHENQFSEIEQATAALASDPIDPSASLNRARALALVNDRLSGLIDQLVDRQPQIETETARVRARRALTEYGFGASLMPNPEFQDKAKELQYDVEALAEAYSAPFEIVAHRLTALPQSDDSPEFGYFRANAAGTIIEMRGLDGLATPRYTAACPLWVLYRAQQSPEAVLRQRTLFPTGTRFVFVARARISGPTGFGKPRHYITDMIAMSEADAALTIYAPDPTTPVEEVGPSCRLCPRRACIHRVEDPLAE